jgi:hypothetical protein
MDNPKLMSEDRIGRPRPARKERQGLPEALQRGNRLRAFPGLREATENPEKRRKDNAPIGAAPQEPIV